MYPLRSIRTAASGRKNSPTPKTLVRRARSPVRHVVALDPGDSLATLRREPATAGIFSVFDETLSPVVEDPELAEPVRGRSRAGGQYRELAPVCDPPSSRSCQPAPPPTIPPAPRFIRSSSAPLAPALLHTTQEQFGAPAIPAYGMTETAHQAASNPLPCDGVGKDASVGLPSGLQVRIITASGNPAKEVAMANDPQPTDDPEPGGSDILGPEPGGTDILGPEPGGTDVLRPGPG